MSANITLRGATRATAKLKSLEDLKAIKPVVKVAGLHVAGKLKAYPPATAANAAGPYPKRWYERGWGQKWALKGGGVGGGKKGQPTSQTLGKRWAVKMRDGGLTAVIGNSAKYARVVQDMMKQAWFHAARMWPTVQGVADNERRFVMQLLQAAIKDVLNK